ncbi:hypothetical protein ACFL5V_02260 [Fibrobacterota bacterium]
MKKQFKLLTILLCLACFSDCDLFSSAKEKLNILKVEFSSLGFGLGNLLYPSGPALATADSSDFGFDLTWLIKATNPNSDRAVFQGADAILGLNNVNNVVTAPVPAFTVEGDSSTEVSIVFPFRLDNPALTDNNLYLKILNGESIPYTLDATLFFNLIAPIRGDTLGNKSITLELLDASIPTRPDQAAIDYFLTALDSL